MKKNIIEEHTSDGPGTIIDRDGLVEILDEEGEIIKPIIKKDTAYEEDLDMSGEKGTQLRAASFDIGFTRRATKMVNVYLRDEIEYKLLRMAEEKNKKLLKQGKKADVTKGKIIARIIEDWWIKIHE